MDGENNFAGNLGQDGGPMPNLDNLGGGGDDGGDINQYYDDAGETFLPADHVSDLNFVNTHILLAPHVSAPKRPD